MLKIFYLLDIRVNSDVGEKLTAENYQLLSEIFPLIGLAILLIGIVISYKRFILIQNSVHGFATVTDMREVVDQKDNKTLYAPIFEFIDEKGKSQIINSASASSPAQYEINQRVKIVYASNSPETARINNFYNIWFTSIMLGVAGIFMVLMGFYLRLFF